MSDIKKIIADNLIALRKEKKLTQNELATKLNYSDNAISRWEHAEVTPNIETLEQISKFYNIPLTSLFQEHQLEVKRKEDKRQLINKLAVTLIFVSLIFLIATIVYVYGKLIFNLNLWMVFCWAIPCSCLIMLPFNEYWGKYIYKFVIFSVFQWTLLACIYLQLLKYNLWLIFCIGIPIQVALAIWAFIKPKEKTNKTEK